MNSARPEPVNPARPEPAERAAAATGTLTRRGDVAPQPWRNGGGRTRELLAWPNAADWRIRISVADIEADGPFSSFPDVQRWFAMVEGNGVELTIDGGTQRVIRGAASLQFSGAAATSCRLLDGPTVDLNLMLRGVSGCMLGATDRVEWRPDLAQCGLYTAVAGRCRSDGNTPTALPAHALLWFARAPASLCFEAAQQTTASAGWWLEAGNETS
jgi:uncharacterized protein